MNSYTFNLEINEQKVLLNEQFRTGKKNLNKQYKSLDCVTPAALIPAS